jgi:hypothetical protein
MRSLLLLMCLLAAPIRTSQERVPAKPDGVYISVRPVEGKAMVGDNLIDAVVMIEGSPMKQYANVQRIEDVFDAGVLALAVLAESHGGEAVVHVQVVKNGRETLGKAAQGRQVVLHYSPWGEPYLAVFPRR